MPRLFIAIQVPPLRRLVEIYRELQGFRPAVRPVHPDLLHLTLRFLGDTPPDAIPDVEQVVRPLGAVPAFDIALRGLGRFPQVVYARAQPVEPLANLAERLDAALPGRDKPFAAHLTLARLRRRGDGNRLAPVIDRYRDEPLGSVSVKEVHLIESKLTAAGPRYRSLLAQRLAS